MLLAFREAEKRQISRQGLKRLVFWLIDKGSAKKSLTFMQSCLNEQK